MSIKIENIVDLVKEKKGENIIGIDLKGISSITDYIIIASGNNTRQVISIADNIVEKNKDNRPINKDGYDEGKWIVLDYGDIMVHIFEKEERDHYKIENLWLDANVDYFNEEDI